MRSVEVGRELTGSSPPSVFIGSWNYPKVLAGPLVAPLHGDTRIMDTPESWIPGQITQEEIIGYRLNLVRGKQPVTVTDIDNRFVGQLQEISLSAASIDSEIRFSTTPTGCTLSDEHTPYGPSAPIEQLDIGAGAWDRDLEKVFHDTDLKAADAVIDLHRKGIPFSSIQKAFSVGVMGAGKTRRLVPTRWSITACDTVIGDHLLEEVRHYDPIDCCQVYEFSSLHNHYAILLTPTGWQYEWTEAFLGILGHEEMVFSDYERSRGKKGYSSVGGCYYSCKMAVLEALAREKKQAGALILREATRGYVPLGVFNVRENVRNAMLMPPVEYEDIHTALTHISDKMTLPVERFTRESTLLRDLLRGGQTKLSGFIGCGDDAVPDVSADSPGVSRMYDPGMEWSNPGHVLEPNA
jgi:hypothetical protein